VSLRIDWEGEPVAVWRALWDVPEVEIHEQLGSTNDRARELASKGAAPWTVVLAEEQTRGRGRSGDAWHSPPGSGLWISTVVPAEGPPAPCLPLRVGLAAARATEEVSGVPVGIKWPNDLIIAGRKVGGVLCERADGAVVAGVGINVRTPDEGFPSRLAAVATSAEEEAGRRVPRGGLATLLLVGLRDRLGGSEAERLDADEMAELTHRDVLMGRRLRSETGEGTGRGIDAGGALRIERPDGRVERVVAGRVRLL
jgi:BirA family biotin operon repressor/biotin-[acetyl-CoA-carboxylase] ligase